MEIENNIVNKVALSGLITIDLATYAPKKEIVIYDIKDNLFHGLILREKEFRTFLKEHDWTQYSGKHVGIICSTDAIVPTWAYMLLASYLKDHTESIHYGDKEKIEEFLFLEVINKIDFEQFRDQRIVVKGCGEIHIPESAFVNFTSKLLSVARSIMYGEPCSTVPVYKRKS